LMAVYCLVQFVLLLGLGVQFLQTAMQMPGMAAVVYLVFLIGTLGLLGALLEGRRLALWLEAARLLLLGTLPVLTGLWLDGSALPVALRMVCAAVSVVSFVVLLLAWRNGRVQATDGDAAVDVSASTMARD